MDGVGEERWTPGLVWLAMDGAAQQSYGYQWRGMILVHSGWGEPRTETQWALVHAGSGTRVAMLKGNVATVFPVATEIALCVDWTLFDLPNGWRQTDPDLPDKVLAILDMHPEVHPVTRSSRDPERAAQAVRAVIEARESGYA